MVAPGVRPARLDARAGETHPAAAPLAPGHGGPPHVPPGGALYVADQVLGRALCAYQLCDGREPGTARDLNALGARLTWNNLEKSWIYEHTWLLQARALDRDSPLGQRMLLFQMNHARDFTRTATRIRTPSGR